jgi:hypothetical protein
VVPGEAPADTEWSHIAGSEYHSCFIAKTTGKLYCSGYDNNGVSGLGTPNDLNSTTIRAVIQGDLPTADTKWTHVTAKDHRRAKRRGWPAALIEESWGPQRTPNAKTLNKIGAAPRAHALRTSTKVKLPAAPPADTTRDVVFRGIVSSSRADQHLHDIIVSDIKLIFIFFTHPSITTTITIKIILFPVAHCLHSMKLTTQLFLLTRLPFPEWKFL